MIRSTTILRARPGLERAIREALLDLAEMVQEQEVGTLGFHIVADAAEPTVFVLLGRFVDRAALDAHNNSDVMNRFLFAARSMLDGPVTLSIGEEIFGFDREA